MKKLLAILTMCAMSLFGYGDTLWWQVDDSATVDGQSLYSFVSSYGTYEYEWEGETYIGYNVGARVKITNPDGSTAIVPIAYPEYPSDRFYYAEFFDGGGANAGGFGTGYWTNQSLLHEVPGYNSEMLTETAFMVELGLLTYDDVLNVVGWETIANSETVFASQVKDAIWGGGVLPPAKI